MGSVLRFARKLEKLAQVVANPRLLQLRARGGEIDTYLALDQAWLRDLGIQTVLDIGANVGQFAIMIGSLLPDASVHSFEPLADCFAELERRLRGRPRFTAHNVALGATTGTASFERNEFTPSSSFLPIGSVHVTAFPQTARTRVTEVRVKRLDDVFRDGELAEPLLVKIDVQGYEKLVLEGGERTIRRARVVLVEMSFEELYRGQAMFDALYRVLVSWGFSYRGALSQSRDPATGRFLWEDGIFVRA